MAASSGDRKEDERGAFDHYQTPPRVVRALFSREGFPGPIWEPCAGGGAMALAMRSLSKTVVATTVEPDPYGVERPASEPLKLPHDPWAGVEGGIDCLSVFYPLGRSIVTNPPYGRNLPERILRHAITIGVEKVALYLMGTWLSSETRVNGLFKESPPSRVIIFGDRISLYPAGWTGKKGSTPAMSYWVIWEAPFMSTNIPELSWIMSSDHVNEEGN